jgi:N-acetylglucosaminyldiphosphoundecaprenol N-acetyl-beta-D-mannosaminyltransferase
MELLGVKISPVTTAETLLYVQQYLEDGGKHHLVTVNPEFIVEAQKNPTFRSVLNSSDLSLIDGVGVLLALCFLNSYTSEKRHRSPKWLNYIRMLYCYSSISKKGGMVEIDTVKYQRTTGTDLIWLLVQQDWMKFRKVYLLGGLNNVASRAVKRLQQINPDIQFRFSNGHKDIRTLIQGLHSDSIPLDLKEENRKIVDDITSFSPDILFVAYGHPWQDIWIDSVKDFAAFKIAVGVGGAFNFIAKDISRAPIWMRKAGLEWLYRLYKEPQRYKRIMNATYTYIRLLLAS